MGSISHHIAPLVIDGLGAGGGAGAGGARTRTHTHTFADGLQMGSLGNSFVGVLSTITSKASKGCLILFQWVFHLLP